MIRLTRLNHVPIVLNSDLIEYVETTPDTVITLTTGQKIVVLESPDELIAMIIEYRRRSSGTLPCPLLKRSETLLAASGQGLPPGTDGGQ